MELTIAIYIGACPDWNEHISNQCLNNCTLIQNVFTWLYREMGMTIVLLQSFISRLEYFRCYIQNCAILICLLKTPDYMELTLETMAAIWRQAWVDNEMPLSDLSRRSIIYNPSRYSMSKNICMGSVMLCQAVVTLYFKVESCSILIPDINELTNRPGDCFANMVLL